MMPDHGHADCIAYDSQQEMIWKPSKIDPSSALGPKMEMPRIRGGSLKMFCQIVPEFVSERR